MKIRELLEAVDSELPTDGKGNAVVWDPHQRIEVLVPQGEVQKLIARNQIVGGALNISGPSRYPEAPGSSHNAKRNEKPVSQPKGALANFVHGVKTGYKKTDKFTKDLEYTPVGRAARGFAGWAKNVNKGPTIR